MNKALQIAATMALLAIAFAFTVAGSLLIEARSQLRAAGKHFNAAADETTMAAKDLRGYVANDLRPLVGKLARREEQTGHYFFVLEQRTSRLLKHADCQLNGAQLAGRKKEPCHGAKGVLPELSEAIRSNSAKLGEFTDTGTRSVALLAMGADPVLAEARDALHNIGELPNDQNFQLGLRNFASGTAHGDKAAADLEKIMRNLAHPEKPARWLRALSLALTILRGTALAGQSAPVFGK